MTSQHRATPEQWKLLQRQGQTLGSAESTALLELRARIEALEAAQQPHQDKMDRMITIDRDDDDPPKPQFPPPQIIREDFLQ